MLQSLSSPSRRWAAAVALIAFGAFIVFAFGRSEGSSAVAGGDVKSCATLTGDQARACYAREVGLELAAAGGGSGSPRAVAASASSTVTFAADSSAALLCDLHIRVGATDADQASWTKWVAQ